LGQVQHCERALKNVSGEADGIASALPPILELRQLSGGPVPERP
jgi:hypothetical protein